MFDQLPPVSADPILGLSQAFLKDANPDKVDLGVGVYRTESGATPILTSVARAEARLLDTETTKSYQGPAGNVSFNQAMQGLIFGSVAQNDRIRTLQTPGGCGALRVGAELIRRSRPQATVWVSAPTWANHIPLLGNAGLSIREYPYFDSTSSSVDFEAMAASLRQVPSGDLVLLHGCCHNPCGADLNREQWQQVLEIARQREFVPLIDLAYQGFGDGLDEDAYGVRLMADALPEVLVASSCSKNFGLYRERTGAISVVGDNPRQAETVFGHLMSIARGIYSMPPAHGASLVDIVLHDAELRSLWEAEVAEMRARIAQLRLDLAHALAAHGDFSFITRQRGMFSFLGLSEAQVLRLQRDFSVYMVNSSRINIAGINSTNLAYLARSVAAVL